MKRRFCMYYHHLEKILSQFSNVVFWCLYISADNITHIKLFGLKINVRYLTKIILLTKTLEKWKKNIYRLEHYQIITNLNTKFSIAYSHKHRSTRQGENTYFFYKLYEVVYKSFTISTSLMKKIIPKFKSFHLPVNSSVIFSFFIN